MAREKGKMQPLRNKEQIEQMKSWLMMNKGYKYYMLFTLGINTGLRISDLLQLKVSDVRNKTYISIIIQKTNKELDLVLAPYIREELEKYVEGKEDKEYLFTSRVGVNKPISRVMASMVIKEAADTLGLEKVNTHTMRKTFGYWYYKQNRDVYFLMNLFGHQTQTQTLQYIGIELEEIAKTMQNFAL
ncbi:tyrosine-type recombinase/integrase [Bacillus sp. Brlt_9]|uniref:tyrosine-type recombinase/integrase n=1 Tax=Bacillus sp. Brlt_9 TaxID=3110916 RepID=UPI003F7BF87B